MAAHHDTTTNYVPILNQTAQSLLLIILLISTLFLNSSIIRIVTNDPLKNKMLHFLLIRNMCITDLIGSIVVLPVALWGVVMARSSWCLHNNTYPCSIVAVGTSSVWIMHLISVSFYRIDRLLAIYLPIGKYPLMRDTNTVNIVLILCWLGTITTCTLITVYFGSMYQPLLILCIPNMPLWFLISVFSVYAVGLFVLLGVNLWGFLRKRRKRRLVMLNGGADNEQIIEEEEQPQPRRLESPDKIYVVEETNVTGIIVEEDVQGILNETDIATMGSSSNTTGANVDGEAMSSSAAVPTATTSNNNKEGMGPADAQEGQIMDNHQHRQRRYLVASTSIIRRPLVILSNNYNRSNKKLLIRPALHRHLNSSSNVLLSYSITLTHLLLYLPSMMLIGLVAKPQNLPKLLAVLCGFVVYAEFIVQPVALVCLSGGSGFRREVFFFWWR